MALDTYAGSFNITTDAATSIITVTDPGFPPKAVIFEWGGETASSDTINRTNHYRGVGFATGTTSRRVVVGFSEDAQAAANTDRGWRDDACIGAMDNARAIDGLGDLNQFISTGFEIIIDDQFTTDLRVSYLALGGTTLTNATVGTFQTPTSTGTVDYTGVGFQPDCVVFTSGMERFAPPVTTGSSGFMIGATSGANENAVLAGCSRSDYDPTDAHAYCNSSYCVVTLPAAGSSVLERAHSSITAPFAADGFRLDWIEVEADENYVFYMALKGGDYTVGNLTTVTDSSLITVSGLPSQPSGALFLSACRAESAADSSAVHDQISVGAFSATDERTAQGVLDEDNVATSEVAVALENDAVYVNISTSSTIQGLMDVNTIESDGFACIMDDPDPVASFVGFLAVGPAAGGTVSKELQDSATFADSPVRDFWGDRLL
jgi:hypothetical protein